MRKILLGIFMILAGATSSFAQNTIYLKQIGSSSTILLEQLGSNNAVGSQTTYSSSTGDTNDITVKQTGSSNIHNFAIIGSNNKYSSMTTGDPDQFTLNCGTTIISCTNAEVNETVTGNLNTVSQTIKGQSIKSTLAITGSSNQVTTNITQSNSTSNIFITGDTNNVNSTMNAVGGYGSTLDVSILGGSNTVLTTKVERLIAQSNFKLLALLTILLFTAETSLAEIGKIRTLEGHCRLNQTKQRRIRRW
jgi:hypothetical protein